MFGRVRVDRALKEMLGATLAKPFGGEERFSCALVHPVEGGFDFGCGIHLGCSMLVGSMKAYLSSQRKRKESKTFNEFW